MSNDFWVTPAEREPKIRLTELASVIRKAGHAIVTELSHDNPPRWMLPGSRMFILTLAFSADAPELSREEIERQIEEFEREILGSNPRPEIPRAGTQWPPGALLDPGRGGQKKLKRQRG
jgi:hypothetical protein